MRPTSLPSVAELASRPHGTRTRYVAGRCRCEPCREANRAYARLRAKLRRDGDEAGLVSATRARRHLLMLREHGIGRLTVSDISGIPPSTIAKILRGDRRHVTARTERRILAVTKEAMHDAKLVAAFATRQRIRALLAEGFTRTELARRLGSRARAPALQIAKRGVVTARTEAKVERLYRAVMN